MLHKGARRIHPGAPGSTQEHAGSAQEHAGSRQEHAGSSQGSAHAGARRILRPGVRRIEPGARRIVVHCGWYRHDRHGDGGRTAIGSVRLVVPCIRHARAVRCQSNAKGSHHPPGHHSREWCERGYFVLPLLKQALRRAAIRARRDCTNVSREHP